MADGFSPSWKGLPATGVGVPVVVSIVKRSMVPGVEFVTARTVALVALLVLLLLTVLLLVLLALLLTVLLLLTLLLLTLLLLMLLVPVLLLLSPPPQPQATPQSVAHKNVCTFDRGRRTIGSRLPPIRPSTAVLAAKNTAPKILRCNVRTAPASSVPSVDIPAPLVPKPRWLPQFATGLRTRR
jgi:hypothetical protein